MKTDHIIHILLFVAIGILMFVVIVKLGQETSQCTLNPLEYGANQLKELNNKQVSCQCNLYDQFESTPTLYFDHNSSRLGDLFGVDLERGYKLE